MYFFIILNFVITFLSMTRSFVGNRGIPFLILKKITTPISFIFLTTEYSSIIFSLMLVILFLKYELIYFFFFC